MSKVIDKEYLIATLKGFDENILGNEYQKKKAVLDKLSESTTGKLLFNGQEIEGSGGTGQPGQDGVTYTPTIGTVTSGDTPSVTVTLDIDAHTAKFNFVLPKGADGKDGRSISQIYSDDSNNIIVKFSDNSTQNIGQLHVDIEADFLTEAGFGKLRYYQGRFQYYDDGTSGWVDATVGPQNPYILQMIPQEMQRIVGVYDKTQKKYKLKWVEAKDTIIENQAAVVVEKVIIRRKKNSVPTDQNDGDEVITVMRQQFGSHANQWYVDDGVTPDEDDVYYYKAFPVSTSGFVNASPLNETKGIIARNYTLYGFHLNGNESNPASMITYLDNVDNTDFAPAHMDYTADTFDYGDWTVDGGTWFMDVRPCLLNRDGTVAKFLNVDNLTLDVDGTDVSDEIQGTDNEYNVMNQNPKTYWYIHDCENNSADFYFSDIKLNYNEDTGEITKATDPDDGDFVCWSNIGEDGSEIDYFYTPVYAGCSVNSVLRSLSGKAPIHDQTAQTEINQAIKNNPDESTHSWYTEVMCDQQLFEMLLLLIGKSTDTQTVFGAGYHTGASQASHLTASGGLNLKGLFYGTKDNNKIGVKVFGMEHFWGNQWRRVAGWINDRGKQKVKMTYGQSDGSTVNGYNLDGQGYIEIHNSTPTGTSGGYVSKVLFTKNGIIPTAVNGSASTYYTDGLWFNNNQVDYAFVGGDAAARLHCGALCADLNDLASAAAWNDGAAPSCKPLTQ